MVRMLSVAFLFGGAFTLWGCEIDNGKGDCDKTCFDTFEDCFADCQDGEDLCFGTCDEEGDDDDDDDDDDDADDDDY